ncbi:MAG: hypothetical protein V3U71_03920 [Cocleimonas sp.]
MLRNKFVLPLALPTLLISALFLSACAGTEGTGESSKPTEVLNTSFYQHWVHSFEEQNGQKVSNIFRPEGSREFPPSKFRMAFAFDTSGECNYKFLSPVDRHEMRNCVFTKIGDSVYLYDTQGKLLSHLSFTVNSATQDRMIMSYGIKAPVVEKKKNKDG